MRLLWRAAGLTGAPLMLSVAAEFRAWWECAALAPDGCREPFSHVDGRALAAFRLAQWRQYPRLAPPEWRARPARALAAQQVRDSGPEPVPQALTQPGVSWL